MKPTSCAVESCDAPRHARGYCGRHYMMWRRHGDPLWAPSMAETFWQRVDRRGPTECWEWTAGRFTRRGGYGRFMWKGRPLKAHRVAFELVNGRPALGEVAHSCDNPPCCNPAHLRDATHAENMADMAARGRSARGERNGHTRLTPADIYAIRARVASGETHRAVASDYGVIRQTVSLIVKGDRWAHL